MDNFFYTCEAFDPEVNFANYVDDIRLYGIFASVCRTYEKELQLAFYDITGWSPAPRN